MAVLSTMIQACRTLIFSPRCMACKHTLAHGAHPQLCTACISQLYRNVRERCAVCDDPGSNLCFRCSQQPNPLQHIRAPFLYDGCVPQLLKRFKFQYQDRIAHTLGVLMLQDVLVQKWLQQTQAIVPIPLSAERLKQRGYNQSERLASVLAKATQVKIVHALGRKRHTQAQSRTSEAMRAQNVAHVFHRVSKTPEQIILVDDIITTGETLKAAARTLRETQPNITIYGIAFARAEQLL